jgi:hypothetical protein
MASNEKVARVAIKKEQGYLYFLNVDGDIYRVKMDQHGRHKGEPALVVQLKIKKDQGFLYFVDGDGDVSRSPSP